MDPLSSSPSMEGFGSADVTSPFHYGSVHDGQYRSDSLEQKLKKQYWKTKQTVIQKLGKNQDEFIVAGDADIDTKLESAHHLQSSCTELLHSLDKYMARLRTVSIQESVMGEHLRTWSETEYTNAGEVMQNVGKLQAQNSKTRYNVIPPLLRMHSEFMVFRDSAISDLNTSIQMLEKSRTEYRAALLWMKDVSDKLHNPDYKDQLIRFREAQATVKEAKRRFEKLKVDLGEKISMVSASRCNLLSRSLPNYQKEMLAYSDTIANNFHRLLVDLRSHHHHQYKVRSVLEEIRDLEAEEMPFNDQSLQDEFSTLSIPDPDKRRPLFDDDDDPLLDLGVDSPVEGEQDGKGSKTGGEDVEEAKKKQTESMQEPFRRVGDPFSFEQVAEQAKVKDLVLGGIEAELRALQNEVVTPREDPANHSSRSPAMRDNSGGSGEGETGARKDKPQADAHGDDVDDLLQLGGDELDNPSLLEQPLRENSSGHDNLFSQWNNFSSFMPETRDGTKSPLSGWEKELTGSPTPPVLTPVSSQDQPVSAATVSGDNASPHPVSPSQKAPSPLPVSSSNVDPLSPAAPSDPTALDESSLPEDVSIDKLLGLSVDTEAEDSGVASELLSGELQSLGISNSPPKSQNIAPSEHRPSSSSGLDAVDSTLFQYHSVQPQYQPQLAGANSALLPAGQQQVPSFRSPLGTSQGPPVFPTQGTMGMAMAPPKFGLVSPMAQGQGGTGNPSMVGAMRKGKEEEKKGNTWMNFFAHLDPLVNEKV